MPNCLLKDKEKLTGRRATKGKINLKGHGVGQSTVSTREGKKAKVSVMERVRNRVG